MSIDIVRAAKAFVIEKGVEQTTNEFPWLVTNLVAFQTGGQLIGKTPPQNLWMYQGHGYGIDAIAYPAQQIEVDCLATAGPPENENRPVWQVNPLKPARYLPPIGPVTIWPSEPVPEPGPIPPNPGTPTVDLGPILARLDHLETLHVELGRLYLGLVTRVQAEEEKPIQPHVHRVGWWTTSGPK